MAVQIRIGTSYSLPQVLDNCEFLKGIKKCLESVFCGRDCHSDSFTLDLASGLADNDALQFILLGIVIVISNGMLVPLNCSHAAQQQ